MLRKQGQRNSGIVMYAHDPPGHTCGLPCCGGDLHFYLRERGRSKGCLSFKAADAEHGNFTLKRQRELPRGNPSFPRDGSFSLQPPRVSTRGQIPEFGNTRGQKIVSNSETQCTNQTIVPHNFLKGREITLPHSLLLPFGVNKKDYSSEESNDFLDLDPDLDIEYYLSVPKNDPSKEPIEQNEFSILKHSRHAQLKGYTVSYDSILDSQSVSNYYESLTFERESFDNISADHSVATKDIECATEAKTLSQSCRDEESKLKLPAPLAFGRNSEEQWDQSTATLKLGFTKVGILYDTKMRETFWEEDAKVSKTLSTNRTYPPPVPIPRVPVIKISEYAQGNDNRNPVEAEQTRQSRLRLQHKGAIQFEAIHRELNDRILNGSTKKFNSYTNFMLLKSVDSYKNNTGHFEKLNSRGHSLDHVSHKRFKRQDVREVDFRSHGEDNVLLKYANKHIRNKDTEISVSLLQAEDVAVLSKGNVYDWKTAMSKIHGG
ncbi:hypothetical protein ACJMK2_025346, partial [Sinanodonta woodiana]